VEIPVGVMSPMGFPWNWELKKPFGLLGNENGNGVSGMGRDRSVTVPENS